MVAGRVGSCGTHHLESGECRMDGLGQVRGMERIPASKGLTTQREGQVKRTQEKGEHGAWSYKKKGMPQKVKLNDTYHF